MDGNARCAHLKVVYIADNYSDGSCSDSWACQSCGMAFRPVPMPKKEVKKENCIICRGSGMFTQKHASGGTLTDVCGVCKGTGKTDVS